MVVCKKIYKYYLENTERKIRYYILYMIKREIKLFNAYQKIRFKYDKRIKWKKFFNYLYNY